MAVAEFVGGLLDEIHSDRCNCRFVLPLIGAASAAEPTQPSGEQTIIPV